MELFIYNCTRQENGFHNTKHVPSDQSFSAGTYYVKESSELCNNDINS